MRGRLRIQYSEKSMALLKKSNEIEIMADAGRRLAHILDMLKAEVKIGVRTMEIEEASMRLIKEAGAKPAFLGYRPAGSDVGYPYSICVSVNEVVVHGQPSEYVVKDGDVVKLDLGLKLKGWYVDSAITIGVGSISSEARKLITVTREALALGIKAARAGATTGDVGSVIERYVMSNKFGVVHSLIGHGIGKNLHEDPAVPNFGRPGEGVLLEPGMVIAIEPMVCVGSGKVKQLADEGFASSDGSLSAHFEHTVAITPTGPKILTAAAA